MKIRIQKIKPSAQAPSPVIPQQMSRGAAGFDLFAAAAAEIPPLGVQTIPCGVALEIPPDCAGFVCPRSGLAQQGITVFNAPGVIDSDYRGELKVILANISPRPFQVNVGDRVAQLVILPVQAFQWEEAESLSATTRGLFGFGSTGVKAAAETTAFPPEIENDEYFKGAAILAQEYNGINPADITGADWKYGQVCLKLKQGEPILISPQDIAENLWEEK